MKACMRKSEEALELLNGPDFIGFRIFQLTNQTPKILEALGEYFRTFGITEFSEPSVVFWELLTNAILHGSPNGEEGQNGSNGQVVALVEHMADRQFKVVVEDSGEGFDYQSLDMMLPEDPRQIKKRGYILINALADRLEFNERGNRITAFVTAT